MFSDDSSANEGQDVDFVQTFFAWLNISGYREERRFLEAHPELATPESRASISYYIDRYAEQPEQQSRLQEYLELLNEIYLRGGTVEAIRAAYVDKYGGFILDLPDWLIDVRRQLDSYSESEHFEQTTPYIPLLRQAIARVQEDANIAPEILAELQNTLGLALKAVHNGACICAYQAALQVYTQDRYPQQYAITQISFGNAFAGSSEGEARTNWEQAIACYKNALQVFTPSRFPIEWITVQNNLGNAYCERLAGEHRDNLEQAIACYQDILQFCTPNLYPLEYAHTKINLGNAYCERIAGEHRDNLEKAIACYQNIASICPSDSFPVEYAMSQAGLGNAYGERIAGEKRENQEQAIACYQAALQIFTCERFPSQYATIQNGLGNIYRERLAGEKRENLEQAISCFQNALQVFTLDTFPLQWMISLNNLGIGYCERIEGNKKDNLERAIACHQAVLQVCARDTFPSEYAKTHSNLGNAYRERINGEKRENLERAIACYRIALQIYTADTYPFEYAMTRNGLGNAYLERIAGDRRQNLEKAIACHRAALRIYTPASFPLEYATSQGGLGNAYFERIAGDKRRNLEKAITCYNRALQIYTGDAFPVEYARYQHNLGVVYRERIAGEKRANLEAAIACYQRGLQVFTYDDFPIDYAQTQTNLGTAYRQRIAGDKSANQELAIACYHNALGIYTPELFPADYALAQHNLGDTYNECIKGERRTNLEEAIACYERALQIRTREAFPADYALTQNNLGAAYMDRVEGNKQNNLEVALTCFQAALEVYTQTNFPMNYAMVQQNRGNTYQRRTAGARRINLEMALSCFQAALQVYTQTDFPLNYALLQNDLGAAYSNRLEGDEAANIEEAIACHQRALALFTPATFPVEYAMTQHNLGNAYRERVQGEPHANLEQALTCYQAALQVYTHDAFPAEYRLVQLNRAQAEARGGNWEQVHAAYAAACQAEDLLVALGAGTTGRDAILREGHDARTRDGFALVQLQRVAEAAVAIERGRARGLAEALAINAADPRLIGDKQRRTRYEHACEQFIAAQATLHAALPHHLTESERRSTILERSKAYQNAKACFDQVIAEIRAAQDPADFLVDSIDAATILRAAEYGGTGHALVYLAATPWGGTAVAALGTHASLSTPARFRAFGLPDLTDSFMGTLIEVRLDDDLQHIVGGFVQAQEGAGLTLINAQDWPGTTFREKAAAFSTACRVFGKTSTLVGAIDKVLSIDALTSTVNKPLDTLTRAEQSTLATTLNHYFLQQELERCLETLGKAALRPLITWLLEQGVTSLTLIPCGLLAAFPLLAVPLTDGRTVGETLLTSVAPNARQFLHQENTGTERVGIYAVGDPRPTHQVLEWSEAEACTLATLARHIGLVGQAKVQQQATLVWLRAALEQGYVVDISCHGVFDVDDFLQSALLLARNQRLYLRNLLSHEVDLRGLRLLILSACQTAISDLRSARDEVHSLAAGMLQAGARAVLASLWPVDDKATYLLIVRFAQEWLPNMHREPVAAALGRAQYWLRTVTNRDLQTWQATNAPEFLVESGQKIRSKRLNFNLWQQKESQLAGKGQLSAVRGRGYRYEPGQAENIVQASAIQRHSPDACPYAHPIYWAGFQIVGW